METGVDDIRAANELMAVALSRSLDDLPPQTRKLLGMVQQLVGDRCREQAMDRNDFRFTFREVKAATCWGDTQLTRRHQFQLSDDAPETHGPPASWLTQLD